MNPNAKLANILSFIAVLALGAAILTAAILCPWALVPVCTVAALLMASAILMAARRG